MSSDVKNVTRRDFLQKTATAGALISLSPFTRLSYAQSPAIKRVTIAHGVGVYSLNPYAVTTSPIQGAWGSVMEALIDADYDNRGYRGLLAESWEMKGNKVQFKLRKGVRFHDGTSFTAKDVIAFFNVRITVRSSGVSISLMFRRFGAIKLCLSVRIRLYDATTSFDVKGVPS